MKSSVGIGALVVVVHCWNPAYSKGAYSTSGYVDNIAAHQITVREYDEEDAREKKVIIDLDKSVKLIDIPSLKEIQIGDYVEIEYRPAHKRKKATSIELIEKGDFPSKKRLNPPAGFEDQTY